MVKTSDSTDDVTERGERRSYGPTHTINTDKIRLPVLEPDGKGRIFQAESLEMLTQLPSGTMDMVYFAPPSNSTGNCPDTLTSFLKPRLVEVHRVLATHGTLWFHMDCRMVHYGKILLDGIFGRTNFINEIIRTYESQATRPRSWPTGHDNLLLYVKDTRKYVFRQEAIERIPYMAPGLVGPEKAARGKLPTDTWWHTQFPTGTQENTDEEEQKWRGVLRRMIEASSRPGALILDCFARDGATGVVALELGRRFLLAETSPESLAAMTQRFGTMDGISWGGFESSPPNCSGHALLQPAPAER